MKTKKIVLLVFAVLLNLLLGAWIDRMWLREPGSVPTQTLVGEPPISRPLASGQTRNPRAATSAELKKAKETAAAPPVRSSAEFKAAADQEWKKPGANPKAVLGILGQWAQTDPQAAIAWVSALPKGDLRAGALKAIFSSWVKKDAPGAANFAEALPMGKDRQQAVASVAAEWAGADPETAITWARQLADKPSREAALQHIALRLCESNASKAAEVVVSLPAGEVKRDLVSEVARRWASEDLPMAREWMGQLADPTDRESAFRGLVRVWTQTEPDSAIGYLNELNPGSQMAVLKSTFIPWGERDPASAMAAATKLENEKARSAAIAMTAGSWANSSPAEAADFVARLPNGPSQISAGLSVAANWAERDPASAAQWVINFPEGGAREKAVSVVVRNWAEVDAGQASNWIETLPAGLTKDTALSSFAGGLSHNDPALAVQWAQRVSEPKLRDQALVDTLHSWMQTDPVAAGAWLGSSGLPEGLKEHVLNPKRK